MTHSDFRFDSEMIVFDLDAFQWSHNGDCTLSPDWTSVPRCSCRYFGSCYRMWCKTFWPKTKVKRKSFGNVCLALLISLFQATSGTQPSSLWWPEHCRDENKMNVHKQQAAVYHTLKGLLFNSSVEIITITVTCACWPWLWCVQVSTPLESSPRGQCWVWL